MLSDNLTSGPENFDWFLSSVGGLKNVYLNKADH